MTKLFYAPGTCSIGIHFLLERLELPYERQAVDIRTGENREPWFLALNPKAKVPTLQRDDGSVLTEFLVIARYLTEAAPERGLVPDDPETALRAAELSDFLVSTIHMQGFSRIFRPMKFSDDPESHPAIQDRGRAIVRDGLHIAARSLQPGGALASRDTFADAALFYVLFWAIDRVKLDVPAVCAERYAALKRSGAAHRVFQAEGIAP